ncbi:unnamed protein product [Diabrotica balteata]|uniref:Uncharacterized protein n=1 Tax=Diabrotica balteata TaxID=107213 RepID=A0A9N9XFK3_DIABA|nr:unnamed protein product [Diabrotica balteata]
MASLKPKYNNKVTVAVLMAPIAYTANIRSPLLRPIIKNMNRIKEILNKFDIHEILGYNHLMAKILSWIVSDGSPLQQFATHLVFLIYGYDNDQLNKVRCFQLF